MRWWWARQTHRDTADRRRRGPAAPAMMSAMQTQQRRLLPAHMEAGGRGASQQERRCVCYTGRKSAAWHQSSVRRRGPTAAMFQSKHQPETCSCLKGLPAAGRTEQTARRPCMNFYKTFWVWSHVCRARSHSQILHSLRLNFHHVVTAVPKE